MQLNVLHLLYYTFEWRFVFVFWLGPGTEKFRVCVVIADMQSSNKSTNISPRTAAHPHSPSTSASPRYGEKQHVKYEMNMINNRP